MDLDGDGVIDLKEWIRGKTAERLANDGQLINRTFRRIASSGRHIARVPSTTSDTGDSIAEDVGAGMERETITTEEILMSFGDYIEREDLQEIIDEIDENGDGVIDLKEFKNAMRQTLNHVD